ncbi:SDR family oxidoreductase [Williamsia serinedens]|uniref:NAD(P)-dependent dehydrogenase, short-chain alcohol dehydrogenase family n=1 Tax=Williamsia serinedens TaxID=391736 RepID=A0ABT1HB13_9NOCA|nr:SDR family oxidoreductase [Williamsia serinedens]MCP2163013.1 NAD(P)-dependent dehydrogenase, short-chain alcohol dehydrogenase family [Williamsia serinedens]
MAAVKDRTVLIVGGSSGIGVDVARSVLARGGVPVIAGRSQEKIDSALGELGEPARGVTVDLTDENSIASLPERAGAVDHLVLSAAALTYAPFTELSVDDARAVMDSKFWGYYRVVRAFAESLPDDGSVTLFSGVASARPDVGTVAVTTTNAAVEGLARSLAVELAPRRANAVNPGVVDSPSWAHLSQDERTSMFEQTADSLPVGRVGRPEDVAAAVLFLIENGYTTGEVLTVDGGARLV